MSSEFDDDTELVAVPGGFQAEISSRWDIRGRPNGGYLLALAARALGRTAGLPDPVTVTGHFLRPPEAGPARVETELVRRGRGHATAAGRLVQGDQEFLRILGTFGDLAAAQGPTRVRTEQPPLPPPEDCPDVRDVSIPKWAEVPPFFERLELRVATFAPWSEGVGRVEGFVRFADGRPPDADSLPLFADAFPPAVLPVVPRGWVPTIELTVHVRNRPAPGWLAAFFRTRFLVGGYLEEDGELWDSTGRLVALSRQLAITRGELQE